MSARDEIDTQPADPSIGTRCTLEELQTRGAGAFVVVGAPSDLGTGGEGGARHGPSEIRAMLGTPAARAARQSPEGRHIPSFPNLVDFDRRRKYAMEDVVVLDVGNVPVRVGESLQAFGGRLEAVVARVHHTGGTPLVLGGDHSVSLFALRAALEKHAQLGVIHFDAHHDMYPSGFGLNHANIFSFALRETRIVRLHQVGLRTLEPVPSARHWLTNDRVSFVSSYELRGMRPEEVFAGLPVDLPYYVTFDVDCMQPELVRETGMPSLGGISYYQGLDLFDYIARTFHVVGADFVEVFRADRQPNMAARVVVQYMAQLFLGRAKYETL